MTYKPTDAELDALRQADNGELNFVTLRQFRIIARAALAKWGSPVVAGEPCGWAMFRPDGSLVHGSCEDSADACLFALSESEVACGKKPGFMAANNGWKPHPIYTTPQPAHAQAGAVPLTVDEIEQLIAQWSYELHGDRARYLVRMTEKHHGIKEGGQHAE